MIVRRVNAFGGLPQISTAVGHLSDKCCVNQALADSLVITPVVVEKLARC